MENEITVLHFDEEYSILVPLEKSLEEYSFSNDFYDDNLYWFCNIFSLKDQDDPEYYGCGCYVDSLSNQQVQYDTRRYELKSLKPGDYLYGVGSTSKDCCDPSLICSFLEYAKEHHLNLGDTAYLELQFINREEQDRKYYYDVCIPIIK